jgi:myosin regulatory light chain 12
MLFQSLQSATRTAKPSPLSYLSPSSHGNSRRRSASGGGGLNQLTAVQISQLKESFTLLDKDGDGVISPEDLGAMLASLGLDSSPAAVQQHLASAPSPFNLASYLTHLSQHLGLLSPVADLLAAFEAFDENDDGTVDVEELKAALTGMGERMTQEDVDRALKGFTRRRGLKRGGGGGEVFRYTEFVDLLAGKSADDEDSGEN